MSNPGDTPRLDQIESDVTDLQAVTQPATDTTYGVVKAPSEGDWTIPGFTPGTNVDSVTLPDVRYLIIGNTLQIYGVLVLNCTGNGYFYFDIPSLPPGVASIDLGAGFMARRDNTGNYVATLYPQTATSIRCEGTCDTGSTVQMRLMGTFEITSFT